MFNGSKDSIDRQRNDYLPLPVQRCFRSGWLCSEEFTQKIRPLMDKMVRIEARDNNNLTNSFLPHVTLFSGDQLTNDEAEAIMGLFVKHCPKGIALEVEEYIEAPWNNPPVQLIFRPKNQENHNLLNTFKDEVAKNTGININMNNQWLHATLLYKNVPQVISEAAVLEARNAAKDMIGTTFLFDQYAVTTGRAWVPEAIAHWGRVDAKKFNPLR